MDDLEKKPTKLKAVPRSGETELHNGIQGLGAAKSQSHPETLRFQGHE